MAMERYDLQVVLVDSLCVSRSGRLSLSLQELPHICR